MISIIVPVYNVEEYLRECVDSILAQTYRDLEIILVDDASTDNSGKICDEYAAKDPRVKVIHLGHIGLSAARNKGLDAATGAFIGFVDGDDWIEKDMYEILMRTLETTGADICLSGIYREREGESEMSGVVSDKVLRPDEAVREIVYGMHSNAIWNRLYKKKCLEGLRFPENRVHEDVVITCRMFLKADKIAVSSAHLYHYRTRPNSIITTKSMETLRDYCIAYHQRYKELRANQLFSEDKTFMEKLDITMVECAELAWPWMHMIPRKERDNKFMKLAAAWIRKTFPRFGKKNWGFRLKLMIFCCRRATAFHYWLVYRLHKIHLFIWEKFRKEKPEAQ